MLYIYTRGEKLRYVRRPRSATLNGHCKKATELKSTGPTLYYTQNLLLYLRQPSKFHLF